MKMKNKTLFAAMLAVMMLMAVQVTAFATADTSLPDVSGESQVSEDEFIQNSEAVEGATHGDETQTPISGNINESPNTGISVAPFAVAMLAAACIPVILRTRK